VQEPNFLRMMWLTKVRYHAIKTRQVQVDPRFEGGTPESELFDKKLSGWAISVGWGVLYTLVYMKLATHWWMFLLLPFHYVLGPIHGAIVNWAGHKLGYRNYASDDRSKNTLVVDVLTMGELFQNNHHKWSQSPNFAVRWFELDPSYQIMRVLHAVGIIDMSGAQKARWRPQSAMPVLSEAE
jgi:stearoyl-CoA desaturase (delta-9 desaturase)